MPKNKPSGPNHHKHGIDCEEGGSCFLPVEMLNPKTQICETCFNPKADCTCIKKKAA